MVSSGCPGFYQTRTPQASPSRKLHIDPRKDYSKPLNVETSVEYDLPAHLYPPKGSQPILMIHPGFVASVPRARSREVITPLPTVMLATSGAARSLQHQQQAPLTNSTSSHASRSSMSWCLCGNPKCNSNSAKSTSVQHFRDIENARNIENTRYLENIRNIKNVRNIQSVSNVRKEQNMANVSGSNNPVILQKPQQERTNTVIVIPSHLDRNSVMRLQQPSTVTGGTSTTASTTNTTQPFVLASGGRCRGACCNPRPAAIVPQHGEFVTPGLPPSLLASIPTRGTAGGSPKIKGARSRRGLSIESSVHPPNYLAAISNRSTRVAGNTIVHSKAPRVPSTTMSGTMVATPAPPMAHQNIPASLTTPLDLSSLVHNLTPKSLFTSQQPVSMGPPLATSIVSSSISSNGSIVSVVGTTSSLLAKVVDLSRDSGCSTGGDYPQDYSFDRTREPVDSGFCTPVDNSVPDNFITDMLCLPRWKESPTSYTPVIGSLPTSSLLSGASSNHHYLPQPLLNLVY